MGNVLPIGNQTPRVQLQQPKPVKVIAITGGKGGVGKTTISINLALALARLGKRVLLMDANLGLASIDTHLGLQPRFNLSHVISGEAALGDIIVQVCPGVQLVPAASGILRMAELSQFEQAGLIHAFSELTSDLDLLIVDSAPGVSSSTMQFAKAAHEVVVVVCDEPASITNAYAVIKLLSREHGVSRFHVLVNMIREPTLASDVFSKIARMAERYLDVTLLPMGGIPQDTYLQRAIQKQVGVVQQYPGARSSSAFRKLAKTASTWPIPDAARGHVEFFVERAIASTAPARSPS